MSVNYKLVDLDCKTVYVLQSTDLPNFMVYDGLRHKGMISFPDAKDHVVQVHSFSKTYAMTGLRLGYLAVSREKLLEIDPQCCQAHFNLGNICDDFQDYRNAQALKHFKHAIEINSEYADVHFNMAILYEKMGLAKMANRHWKEYLKIDPQSEWAELVKEHLGCK